MKTIIFNTDSLIMGGAEKIALSYVELLKENYKIMLLVNEDNGDNNVLKDMIPKDVEVRFVVEKNIMDKLNRYRNLKKKNIFYKLMYSIYLNKRRKSYKKNIAEILKTQNFDYLIDFYCKIPSSLIDERTICWLHMTLNNLKEKVKKEYSSKFEKCKNIIVLNEDMRKEVENIFTIDKNKIKKIYNFFNIEDLKEKSEQLENLNLEEKKLIQNKYIFACCRIDKQKDLDTLISAYKSLKEKYNRDEKLYIAGDGDQRERLESYVKKIGLSKEIIFLGTQKNPYVWMKNAEFFIHSSHREGFGMVLVEGLITNGLVVSTDCPVGPKEILENGKSGILIPLKNEKEMTLKMRDILDDLELKKRLKKEALRRMEDFSTENALQKIQQILGR
ncbi:MAG: glycosyltransferase [Cetobacterium sp.]